MHTGDHVVLQFQSYDTGFFGVHHLLHPNDVSQLVVLMKEFQMLQGSTATVSP